MGLETGSGENISAIYTVNGTSVRFGKEEEEVNMYVATLVLRERNLRQR